MPSSGNKSGEYRIWNDACFWEYTFYIHTLTSSLKIRSSKWQRGKIHQNIKFFINEDRAQPWWVATVGFFKDRITLFFTRKIGLLKREGNFHENEISVFILAVVLLFCFLLAHLMYLCIQVISKCSLLNEFAFNQVIHWHHFCVIHIITWD
jgi:hypothetical protein